VNHAADELANVFLADSVRGIKGRLLFANDSGEGTEAALKKIAQQLHAIRSER